MKQRSLAALLGALVLAWGVAAQADAKFEQLAVRVEHNATDMDFEIVFEATGGDTGLALLTVTAPDGRVVIDVKAPSSRLGMRSFRFESPEPKNLASLQTDFPAGAVLIVPGAGGGDYTIDKVVFVRDPSNSDARPCKLSRSSSGRKVTPGWAIFRIIRTAGPRERL